MPARPGAKFCVPTSAQARGMAWPRDRRGWGAGSACTVSPRGLLASQAAPRSGQDGLVRAGGIQQRPGRAGSTEQVLCARRANQQTLDQVTWRWRLSLSVPEADTRVRLHHPRERDSGGKPGRGRPLCGQSLNFQPRGGSLPSQAAGGVLKRKKEQKKKKRKLGGFRGFWGFSFFFFFFLAMPAACEYSWARD